MPGFSIIICTHNPDLGLLNRLFRAIEAFKLPSISCEVIIVDNNCISSLHEDKQVQAFIQNSNQRRVIKEIQPGLTAARIKGIEESKYDWLVFFDDDNEPVSDYLTEAKKIIDQYPQVGAWGPGRITVEYTNNNIPRWLDKFKTHFQERNNATKFSKDPWWQPHYPVGTGLIIKKEIAITYSHCVKEGIYSLSDRKGKSLSSGGDVQLVLTGIKMNYQVGSSSGLKMNHLINQQKANLRYLIKHAFGTASSNLPAHYQVWPCKAQSLQPLSVKQQINRLYYIIKVTAFNEGWRHALTAIAHYLGEQRGIEQVNNQQSRGLLNSALLKLLRLN